MEIRWLPKEKERERGKKKNRTVKEKRGIDPGQEWTTDVSYKGDKMDVGKEPESFSSFLSHISIH